MPWGEAEEQHEQTWPRRKAPGEKSASLSFPGGSQLLTTLEWMSRTPGVPCAVTRVSTSTREAASDRLQPASSSSYHRHLEQCETLTPGRGERGGKVMAGAEGQEHSTRTLQRRDGTAQGRRGRHASTGSASLAARYPAFSPNVWLDPNPQHHPLFLYSRCAHAQCSRADNTTRPLPAPNSLAAVHPPPVCFHVNSWPLSMDLFMLVSLPAHVACTLLSPHTTPRSSLSGPESALVFYFQLCNTSPPTPLLPNLSCLQLPAGRVHPTSEHCVEGTARGPTPAT